MCRLSRQSQVGICRVKDEMNILPFTAIFPYLCASESLTHEKLYTAAGRSAEPGIRGVR